MSPSDERRRVGEAYQRYAQSRRKRRSWQAENPGNVAIRWELLQAVFAVAGTALRKAEAILDVGCGSGWWLATLAEYSDIHAHLYGVDILPGRLAAARERVPTATFALADARLLPHDTSSLDVVTMLTVASSLADAADAETALREAHRVLAPGGTLLIWEPRVPNPLNPDTVLISRRLVRRALPNMEVSEQPLTVLPSVARHLGSRTEILYPRIARIQPLLTHRLICLREH